MLQVPEEPSLSFKINSAQRTLQDGVSDEPLLPKIEELELIIFGELSDDVLAMRAEKYLQFAFLKERNQGGNSSCWDPDSILLQRLALKES